jgi:hypothetical protein
MCQGRWASSGCDLGECRWRKCEIATPGSRLAWWIEYRLRSDPEVAMLAHGALVEARVRAPNLVVVPDKVLPAAVRAPFARQRFWLGCCLARWFCSVPPARWCGCRTISGRFPPGSKLWLGDQWGLLVRLSLLFPGED